MNKGARDVFILAGALIIYGIAIVIYEAKMTDELFKHSPRGLFARHNRAALVAEEMTAPIFTPPADDMGTMLGADTHADQA